MLISKQGLVGTKPCTLYLIFEIIVIILIIHSFCAVSTDSAPREESVSALWFTAVL